MVAAVVVTVAIAESALSNPHAGAEFLQDDAGFFGELPDRRVRERLTRIDASTRQLPPAVIGIVGVASVDEEYPVGLVEKEHASAEARCGGGRGHAVPSGR
jgi:hypothetical protein